VSPEFSEFVDDAALIGTSGRWDAVNTAIKRLAAKPGAEPWYVQLLGGLCFLIFSEYRVLKEAHETQQEDGASLLAWRARNLLELSVWAMYCAKSSPGAAHHRRRRRGGRMIDARAPSLLMSPAARIMSDGPRNY
jgi:hypothetical protein